MQSKLLYSLLLSLLGLLWSAVATADDNAYGAIVFSKSYKGLNVAKAYQLQKAYVRNQASYGNAMVGFKAELNHSSKQKEYGLQAPITGIVMRSAVIDSGSQLSPAKNSQLMVKLGLSFKTAMAIRKPVASVDLLRPYFNKVALTLELPDFNFNKEFNGLDVIANNAMANKIVLGEWQAIPKSVDAISYHLLCDEEVLLAAEHSKIGEGQWQTLLWMVNHLLDQGYTIRADQLLFTGGLGGMIEAQSCHYHAVMPSLDKVSIRIE